MDRLGWIITLIVGLCFFSEEKPAPKPPQPDVDVVDVTPAPAPAPAPAPDEKQKLVNLLSEILKRLDLKSLETLHNKLASVDTARLQTMIGLLDRYGTEKIGEPAAKVVAETEKTVCRCQGHKRSDCLCLKAGVVCHCSKTSGSVWEKVNQSWVKTKAKADPTKPLSEPPPSTQSTPVGGYPVRINGNWAYWNVNGVEWDNRGTGVQDGFVYGGRFKLQGQTMHDVAAASQPVQSSMGVQASGYWKVVCNGNGTCTRVWVSNLR